MEITRHLILCAYLILVGFILWAVWDTLMAMPLPLLVFCIVVIAGSPFIQGISYSFWRN